MNNQTVVAAACVIIACLASPVLAATGADSQYPTRPVRIIVPTSPGGGTDFLTRLVAQRLSERWGQSLVVDNRSGAGGLIGLEILARAAPDGYSLIMTGVSNLLPALVSGRLSFDRDGDFTPIGRAATSVLVLVMHPGVSVKSVKELVELARAKPRQIMYASGGTGSTAHLGMELFSSMAGIELTHVSYKGTGPALNDLLGGRVQFALIGPAPALPHVRAGRLRILAVTGTKRATTFPEAPTFPEAGYPRYDASLWWGVLAPARVPAPLVARLNTDLNWVVQQPDTTDRLAAAGIVPAGGLSPAQFADYIATENVKWNNAIKAAGLR